ncbi:MAG: NAD(P)H-dependent oxidoreductase [Alphaproteobacteria bacterium]|nr:NAD(P)H-dependent oxidoreductase [Alphaproteobacteria bacterium]
MSKNIFLSFLAGTILSSAVVSTVNAKTLVTYFTLTGNTEKAAKIIAEKTGADLYQIELVTPYPSEYKEQTKLAKEELNSGYLPPIKPLPENMAEYDVVFVGSPVWWGTMSTPVRTFLSSGVLKGKTVIPFVTHGGGGADNSFTDTAKLCEGCNVITDGWSGYSALTFGLSGWIEKTVEQINK